MPSGVNWLQVYYRSSVLGPVDFLASAPGWASAYKVIVVRDGPPTLDPQGFSGAGGPVAVLTPAEVVAGVEVL